MPRVDETRTRSCALVDGAHTEKVIDGVNTHAGGGYSSMLPPSKGNETALGCPSRRRQIYWTAGSVVSTDSVSSRNKTEGKT